MATTKVTATMIGRTAIAYEGPSNSHKATCRGGRLRQIPALAFALGAAGNPSWLAGEIAEEDIWADGTLPVDRPSQRRAWRLAIDRSRGAYFAGAQRHIARNAAAAAACFRQDAAVIYDTAYHSARIAWDDTDIIDSVRAALRGLGRHLTLSDVTALAIIKRARYAQAEDRSELRAAGTDVGHVRLATIDGTRVGEFAA